MKTISTKPKQIHKQILKNAIENIVSLKACNNYTLFAFHEGKPQIMAYTLACYGNFLPQSFIRINRSNIINKAYIKNLNYEERIITLSNNSEIQISRRRWNEVRLGIAQKIY
jgi:two-component system, LytTR family, response regulator